MSITLRCVILWVILTTPILAQVDDSRRTGFCQNILGKSTLVEKNFRQLDSILFLINYYTSDTVVALYHRAIRRAEQSADYRHFAGVFEMRLADIYWEFNNLDSTTHYINLAASRFEQMGNELAYARTANIRRLIKAAQGDFLAANQICFGALKVFEKEGDKAGMGITYRDIASIMIHEEKYEEALDYCSRSIETLESIDYWYELHFSYQRMAIIHRNLGEFEKAHFFLQKAIAACYQLEGFRVKQGVAKLYWTKGYIHEAEGKLDQANSYLDSAAYLGKQVKMSIDRWIYDGKGRIFLQQKKYQEALDAFQKELEILTEDEYRAEGYELYNTYNPVYSNLAKAYAGLQQYEQAYAITKEIVAAKDSFFKLESEKQLLALRTKYETEQKEATIVAQAKLLDQQQLLQWFIIGFAALLGLFLFQTYRNAKLRKRSNDALSATNAQLELKNQENELLLKEIHHRVKNNLQTISSLLNLQSGSIHDASAFDAIQESKNRVASMALIHQKLYQGENLAAIEMRDYFETIGKAIIKSFGDKGRSVTLNVDMPELELDVDTAVPIGLITNELLTNSLKYAFREAEEGEVSITLTKGENNLLKLEIADDGQWDDREKLPEDNGGFGTMLVQLLTTQLGGHLEKSTKQGTSTVIQFRPQRKSAA
jgi:two-component sensor histidine kinase